MDNNSIAYLENIKKSLEDSFKKLEKELKKVNKSDKKKESKFFENELKIIETNYDLMEKEIKNLILNENLIEWKDILSQMNKKKKLYEEKINNIQIKNMELISNPQSQDNNKHLDVNTKIDLNKLNVQQVMDRGDALNEDIDKAARNMQSHVNKGIDGMKEVNIELDAQNQNLDNIETDLKEIDFSLKRAKDQIYNMFKIYSSDKIITCLIIFILIIIVTIIIVSACGGDKKNNFNAPHDIFFVSKNNTINSGKFIVNKNFVKYFIYLELLLFDI